MKTLITVLAILLSANLLGEEFKLNYKGQLVLKSGDSINLQKELFDHNPDIFGGWRKVEFVSLKIEAVGSSSQTEFDYGKGFVRTRGSSQAFQNRQYRIYSYAGYDWPRLDVFNGAVKIGTITLEVSFTDDITYEPRVLAATEGSSIVTYPDNSRKSFYIYPGNPGERLAYLSIDQFEDYDVIVYDIILHFSNGSREVLYSDQDGIEVGNDEGDEQQILYEFSYEENMRVEFVEIKARASFWEVVEGSIEVRMNRWSHPPKVEF